MNVSNVNSDTFWCLKGIKHCKKKEPVMGTRYLNKKKMEDSFTLFLVSLSLRSSIKKLELVE